MRARVKRSNKMSSLSKFISSYGAYFAVAAILLGFILFRWQIIESIWEERLTPPEPDDSFGYIAGIRVIGDSGTFFHDQKYIWSWDRNDHLAFLPWRTLLCNVKMLGDFSYVDVYKANFFFGVVFMSFAILYLLNVWEKNKLFWAFTFFFLVLFNGSGAYHGFFWVVPSFYSLGATLLLISIIFDLPRNPKLIRKRHVGVLFLIASLAVFSHPLGKISFAAVALSYMIYLLCSKLLYNGNYATIPIRKVILVIVSGFVPIFCLEVFPYIMGVVPYTYPVTTEIVQISNSAFDLLGILYFDYFSLTSFNLALLVIGLLALLVNKRLSIFSTFLGFFSITLLGSIFSSYGYRMLLFLWPITFIVFSYGCYFLCTSFISACRDNYKKFIGKLKKKRWSEAYHLTKKVALVGFVTGLVVIHYVYPFTSQNVDANFLYADYFGNRMDDWKLDKSIVEYLENVTNPDELIIFADSEAFLTVTSLGLLDREVTYSDWDWSGQFSFLLTKVNGTFLVAIGSPYRDDISARSLMESIFNLVEAFGGRLTLNWVRNFGVLSVYKIIIRQMETDFVFVYNGIDVESIAEDNQTNFWSRTTNIQLADDEGIKVSGNNSLKISLSQDNKIQSDFIWHRYSTLQDWSQKSILIFNWFGSGSGKEIEVLIYASNVSDRFGFTFEDSAVGWNQVIVPLDSFRVLNGMPTWSRVGTIYFRFDLDSPYQETFYLDTMLIDSAVKGSEDLELISDSFRISTQILPFFFLVCLPIGIAWGLFVFRIRDVIALLAISFGASLSLMFLFLLFLNLIFRIPISSVSIACAAIVLTLFPLCFDAFRKILRIRANSKSIAST